MKRSCFLRCVSQMYGDKAPIDDVELACRMLDGQREQRRESVMISVVPTSSQSAI